MSGVNDYKGNLRDQYRHRFTIVGRNIFFDEKIYATVAAPPELPEGFNDRVLLHLVELLNGKRTSIWDDQVVFGSEVTPSRKHLSAARDQFKTSDPCTSYHSMMLNGVCQNCGHLKDIHT